MFQRSEDCVVQKRPTKNINELCIMIHIDIHPTHTRTNIRRHVHTNSKKVNRIERIV